MANKLQSNIILQGQHIIVAALSANNNVFCTRTRTRTSAQRYHGHASLLSRMGANQLPLVRRPVPIIETTANQIRLPATTPVPGVSELAKTTAAKDGHKLVTLITHTIELINPGAPRNCMPFIKSGRLKLTRLAMSLQSLLHSVFALFYQLAHMVTTVVQSCRSMV